MPNYNLGGIQPPQAQTDDGGVILLPEPNGSGREGIEVYGFDPDVLNEYRSEGNVNIEVGKMFLFNANLQWISASKKVLFNLFKLAAQGSFIFWPHRDDNEVKFRCKIAGRVDHKYVAGIKNHPAGYTIKVNMVGVEYLAAPFEGSLNSSDGFGTDWGSDTQNQSP